MIELETLGEDNHVCEWWANFIEESLHMTDEEINQELLKWQCQYLNPVYCEVSGVRIRGSMLAFETQEAATWFMLRWS